MSNYASYYCTSKTISQWLLDRDPGQFSLAQGLRDFQSYHAMIWNQRKAALVPLPIPIVGILLRPEDLYPGDAIPRQKE